MINNILPQYHQDKTIDHDHETKFLLGEIYKMMNNWYVMTMKIYCTKKGIDEFNESQQSQSADPSDEYS